MKPRLLLSVFVAVVGLVFIARASDDDKKSAIRSRTAGWLGVSIQDVTPKFARENELKVKEGAYVNEVVEDSPADSAGIIEEDVITEFNGKKIELADDLTQSVRQTKPGTNVVLKVNRKGETKMVTATIRKNKQRAPLAITIPRSPRVIVNLFGSVEGMQLMDLNKQLGEYFEAPNGRGVLVKEVKKKSNAEKAGVKAGDVIISIDAEDVTDIDDIRDALSGLDEGDKASIAVIRKGKKTSLSLIVAEREKNEEYFPHGENFHYNLTPDMDLMKKLRRELEIKFKGIPRIDNDFRVVRSFENGC